MELKSEDRKRVNKVQGKGTEVRLPWINLVPMTIKQNKMIKKKRKKVLPKEKKINLFNINLLV